MNDPMDYQMDNSGQQEPRRSRRERTTNVRLGDIVPLTGHKRSSTDEPAAQAAPASNTDALPQAEAQAAQPVKKTKTTPGPAPSPQRSSSPDAAPKVAAQPGKKSKTLTAADAAAPAPAPPPSHSAQAQTAHPAPPPSPASSESTQDTLSKAVTDRLGTNASHNTAPAAGNPAPAAQPATPETNTAAATQLHTNEAPANAAQASEDEARTKRLQDIRARAAWEEAQLTPRDRVLRAAKFYSADDEANTPHKLPKQAVPLAGPQETYTAWLARAGLPAELQDQASKFTAKKGKSKGGKGKGQTTQQPATQAEGTQPSGPAPPTQRERDALECLYSLHVPTVKFKLGPQTPAHATLSMPEMMRGAMLRFIWQQGRGWVQAMDAQQQAGGEHAQKPAQAPAHATGQEPGQEPAGVVTSASKRKAHRARKSAQPRASE